MAFTPRERQMTTQGYADGATGRAPRWPSDPTYWAAYRRGQQRKEADRAATRRPSDTNG